MNTIRSFRRFAIGAATVLVLAGSALTQVSAADSSCDSTSSASQSHWPAPGSADALKMAKTPWLYGPRPAASPSTTHFPEPGSAEALRMAKTPYLYHTRVSTSADSGKRWPTPGSAEALKMAKTPYLMNRRPAADSACP